ncbi:Facilitated trehalose transporter Tret1 [Papilio xuthus]|uniref:Facilitated trehalose transporter Tret1 n=1 Tax=Papilio xuthus TaxID=66420 RepID=A0A194QJI7_PAPXU|nr:Facilitated trehalose transporter Tret1 [Papilio xuthus]
MSASKRTYSPFVKQSFVTAAVCINIVCHGCVMGFPAILLPQLRHPGSPLAVPKSTESWIASVHSISMLLGYFLTPPIMERLGRKLAHYAVCIPFLVGWFMIVMAESVHVIIIGRILHGLSSGLLTTLRSVLIGEYTSPRNRGAFLTTISLAQAFGIFFVHLVGSLLSWRLTALVCAFFSYTSFIMTMFIPESPSWLVARGRFDECRAVFHWLRGDTEDDELEDMINTRIAYEKAIVRKRCSGSESSRINKIWHTMTKKEFYKPIILMIHGNILMQFAGGTTMSAYSTVIIGLLMGPGANAHFWMVFLDTQRIISNSVAVYVINRTKRRTMLFSTGALCVVSHLAIAAYVYARHEGIFVYDAIWLPALLINIQFFTVAVGMVPLPNVIAGEVFPLEHRSICGSISLMTGGSFMFVTLKTFPYLVDAGGLQGTYLLYAALLTYNLAVMWVLLPETRGKTLQQIEAEFRGRALRPEEAEARHSLHADPVEAYKSKLSLRRCSSAVL